MKKTTLLSIIIVVTLISSIAMADEQVAQKYLKTYALSYNGVVLFLLNDGYTLEQATYAADNCGANWYIEALKAAKCYLHYQPYSYQRLFMQLRIDGFTPEEAKFAVDNCGADWTEQARISAQQYLAIFPNGDVVAQLSYEGFTLEQILGGLK